MAPLVALGLTLLPSLTRLLVGERAGDVAATVATAVQQATGTADPAAAEARLAADPAAAAALRLRLAEIALEAERLRMEAEARQRAQELEAMRAGLADVRGARGTMLAMVRADAALSWAPATVSVVVTAGFFATIGIFLFWTPPAEHQQAYSLLNIAVGALVAGFTAVVNFWIGSSQGSRDKDATVRSLAQQQARLAGDTIGQAAARAFAPGPAASPPAAPSATAALPPAPDAEPPGARFARCLELVLQREGGFAEDPEDRGGPSMFGITEAMLAEWRGRAVRPDEVAALTEAEAREICRARFWNTLRCDDLPAGVDLLVLDTGMKAGPGIAARLLQRVAGAREDGAIGPVTLAALRLLDPVAAIDRLAALRAEHGRGLPGFARFGQGWLNRMEIIRRAAREMAAGQ